MKARALWIEEAGRAAIREETLAPPGTGEVLVRALFSGVSRGTESLVFRHRVPASQRAVMRAPFQQGELPGPVKYGYASVGVVEAGELPAGTRVFCLHPHQDRYVVPASAVLPLPDGLPADRAVLAANLETAINGSWDAHLGAGDRVAVVGAGVVGALSAWLAARVPGTEVELVDVVADRGELAHRLGVGFALPEDAAADRDLVVEASGTSGGLATALRLAGQEATVVALSWYGEGEVGVPLGEAFHSRRLTLRSSQVGQLPPERRARFTHRRRLALALALLAAAPELDALTRRRGSFDALPDDLRDLASAAGRAWCHVVRYPDAFGGDACTA